MAWWSPPTSCEKPSPPSGMHGLQKWGIQQWGPFLSEHIASFRSFLTPTSFVFTALTAVHKHALVPASRKTQSGCVFAEFYQATTFLILTLLPAAVCAESDNQQDMEREDSEPARIAQQPHLLSLQRDPGGGSHLCQACGMPCCVSQARGGGMEDGC
ncbi:hypothetical protein B0H16DRAFT_1616357 [Mycena metata]|uniref:Uncharacterized protein n=1 Tax=Mycena metata TaxID=1033252 RepID=A0AAD7MG39_9AGAR|nr:hypothetical protein B0H16DRAFT_1616357 [Mycena metata]